MRDLALFAWRTIGSHRLRTVLSMLGIAIGIAAVVLLTSIGEGTRVYLLSQFTQFGTQILAVHPGKSETLGLPGVLGGTTQKLTLDDARALERLPGVEAVMPLAYGTARVEGNGKGRSVVIYGTTPAMDEVWKWKVRQGTMWPDGDPRQAPAMTVLGVTLKRELFGDESPLGQFVRIGGARFRVVGLMEPKGRMLGLSIDDSAFIPVGRALELFNLTELSEINLLYGNASLADQVEKDVRRVMTDRHRGREDVTVVSQTAMLEVFGNVMDVITMSVAAIAGISLLVGAVGILTMMWIAVGERTEEIGLLRSIGATRAQVQTVFLTEAALLSTLGGVAGLSVGFGICAVLRLAVPGLPISTPPEFAAAAVAVSLATGLASGVLPARRAASLDPIEALRAG